MKSAQLLRRNESLVFVGLYLVFIARKKVAKDLLILQNPTANYTKHSRL